MIEAPRVVFLLWWITLIVVVVVVLPVLVFMLHRAFRAARQIERYTALCLAGGVSLAGQTANTEALTTTISVATRILGSAGSIEDHVATIERVMTARAGGSA